jgi:hypothetical protein
VSFEKGDRGNWWGRIGGREGGDWRVGGEDWRNGERVIVCHIDNEGAGCKGGFLMVSPPTKGQISGKASA